MVCPVPVGRTEKSRPAGPCEALFQSPSIDGGNSPRPIRHFRTGGTSRTGSYSTSQAPFYALLAQKTNADITNLAGRLSVLDATECPVDSQGGPFKKLESGVLLDAFSSSESSCVATGVYDPAKCAQRHRTVVKDKSRVRDPAL